MKHLLIGGPMVAISSPVLSTHTTVIADQGRLDLAAIFSGDYHYAQTADRFGYESRTAIDASGRVIGSR
jgi:hypothetical protein